MNVTIAIDSLKGSLSSLEAGHAIEEGIRRVYKNASVNVRPLADGGEGTVEALACGMGGRLETVTVTGPLGAPVECQYGIPSGKRHSDPGNVRSRRDHPGTGGRKGSHENHHLRGR